MNHGEMRDARYEMPGFPDVFSLLGATRSTSFRFVSFHARRDAQVEDCEFDGQGFCKTAWHGMC
jgi:hypothetical protein